MLAIGKVMVRTHEKVSLTTSESDTGYRGWQKPMSASATQIFINQVNLTAPAKNQHQSIDFTIDWCFFIMWFLYCGT